MNKRNKPQRDVPLGLNALQQNLNQRLETAGVTPVVTAATISELIQNICGLVTLTQLNFRFRSTITEFSHSLIIHSLQNTVGICMTSLNDSVGVAFSKEAKVGEPTFNRSVDATEALQHIAVQRAQSLVNSVKALKHQSFHFTATILDKGGQIFAIKNGLCGQIFDGEIGSVTNLLD